ncbi:glycosyltransferase [Thalassococcus sp. BH17M4-6]|uniref:glycosyltransferase n=1 Tax=Thalassococcus sp. BH17M4-6 TaxID=3413148 RepID=UPI003BC86626
MTDISTMKHNEPPFLKVRRPHPQEVAQLAASPLFDADWYVSEFPDVDMTGLKPEEHYLWVGALMLRDPSPQFSTRFYLEDNPDVARAGVNPLVHYLRSGRAEGRRARRNGAGANDLPTSALAPATGPDPWLTDLRRSRMLAALPNEADDLLEQPGPAEIEVADALLAEAPAPQVSVVMPSWNRADVVGRALKSALNQSLPPFEILLVDDGSTDDTVARVRREFAPELKSGRIRLLESDHTGVSGARNVGLAAARGDMIAYLDSDNLWRRDYLRIMCALFAECDEVMTAYAGLAMNDLDNDNKYLNGRSYDRQRMIGTNFIDLNVFMHRREIYDQYGGFDEGLKRLVDWDLILRYTRLYEPVFLPFVGVDYFLDGDRLGNITRTVSLEDNKAAVLAKLRCERFRRGLEAPKIGYVLWDWPALSQSFVLAELEWLVREGVDVEVFYHVDPDKAATLGFPITAHRVENHEHLARLLTERDRSLVHAHFAYPATTLMAWPACQAAGIPFTFFAHAVDIFHEKNVLRNRIAEVVADPLCLRLFVHGDHHRGFLENLGVPTEKIAYNFQAVDLDIFREVAAKAPPVADAPRRGIFVGRFVEKKGIETLIAAAAELKDDKVAFDVYGYGPLDAQVREKAKALGLTNLVFHGPLDGRKAVRDALAAADFVVVPSIVAENGDTEGFPTIILEAMAAGRPVVTTTVSSIPDFLDDEITAILTPPADATALADGVRRLAAMAPDRLDGMLRDARSFVDRGVGLGRTMQTYFDTWEENLIDIVLVTYNTPEYQDIDETREIIRRIRTHTTTPYTLTVVDNGSDPAFRDMLLETARTMPQMRLLRLRKNRFCGPATNLALASSDAVFTVYVCSKEGFIARHGWERHLLEEMRANPGTAMGGTLCHMPKFTRGDEIVAHPDFERFRHTGFAKQHPGHAFRHVQGGVYILRRDAVGHGAAFSDDVPQGNTDVEFSYFLESRGKKLDTMSSISSLTVKTLPRLTAVMDEHTAIAHPHTLDSVHDMDRLQLRDTTRCNICEAWNSFDAQGRCGTCGSDGLERKLYQRLAHDWRAHRGAAAGLVGFDKALAKALGERMFRVTRAETLQALPEGEFSLLVLSEDPGSEAGGKLAARLAPGGLMIWPEGTAGTYSALSATAHKVRISHRNSRVLKSDWRRLCEVERAPS